MLRLSVKGPGKSGRDIQTDGTVEILNPGFSYCHLSDDGNWICRLKFGLAGFCRPTGTRSDHEIGRIPIDSIFRRSAA